jgi:hypothetical protein
MFGPQDAFRGREGSIMAKRGLPEKEAEERRVEGKTKFGCVTVRPWCLRRACQPCEMQMQGSTGVLVEAR